MEAIQIQATEKDLDTIALSLPANLRESFQLYKLITLDHPNHTEQMDKHLSITLPRTLIKKTPKKLLDTP